MARHVRGGTKASAVRSGNELARFAGALLDDRDREIARLRRSMKEARRLIGFMSNAKIAEAARVLETALEQ